MGISGVPVLPGLHFGTVGDLTMTERDKRILAVNVSEQRRRWARQASALRVVDPKHGDGGAEAAWEKLRAEINKAIQEWKDRLKGEIRS
jgi:protein-tyrosine-phosphatase